MNRAMIALGITAAAVAAGVHVGAEQAALLQPGEYRVRVRLELPNVEDTSDAARWERICVTAGHSGTRALIVLSDSNPLRKCPVSNVRDDGDTLTYDIVCPGSDAAVGAARYSLRADSFEGAIVVKMGGKNMTMIERQSGRRAGSC